MKTYSAGFTLIEIAIVLVVIGLLLGGVLKGQELINSAKVKKFRQRLSQHPGIPLWLPGQIQGAAGRPEANDTRRAVSSRHHRDRLHPGRQHRSRAFRATAF